MELPATPTWEDWGVSAEDCVLLALPLPPVRAATHGAIRHSRRHRLAPPADSLGPRAGGYSFRSSSFALFSFPALYHARRGGVKGAGMGRRVLFIVPLQITSGEGEGGSGSGAPSAPPDNPYDLRSFAALVLHDAVSCVVSLYQGDRRSELSELVCR